MPRNGSSVKAIRCAEDDMAVLMNAGDCVDQLRVRDQVMYQRRKMTAATYRDSRDLLDYIAGALMIGRKAVGQLRREAAR